jgi:hypothetical protein
VFSFYIYPQNLFDPMRVSKYLKLDRNVLMEYIYDDGNLIGEAYNVGINIKSRIQNYMAADTSGSLNTQSNTLFLIDPVSNQFGKFDTDNYAFLQRKEYSSGFPIRHDTVKLYFPINWTFGEYLGVYLRVYGFDADNVNVYDLSNFYYDISDINQNEQVNILNYVNPPLYFQEKLWGKVITLQVPSLHSLSIQRGAQALKSNGINTNLTQNVGFNQQSPVFVDFRFITNKSSINGVTTYTATPRTTVSVPQSPEFESIGLVIEESRNGDFFEIYATYNGNIGDFNDFINRSVTLGNRYYLEYTITVWEQNIRGKPMKLVVTEDFLSKVEFRPIIKFSTTTAIIDVEMNMIDAVNNSQILRKASFGMLQDMVSKYSLRLMKINLSDASKPKIYNLKQTISAGGSLSTMSPNTTQVEVVRVPYPVLTDRLNVIAKSESAAVGEQTFWGMGRMQLLVYPFDNIFKFVIARNIRSGVVEYMDLSNMGEIKLVFKNPNISVECPIFSESGENVLTTGFVVFKLNGSRMPDVRRIYESGINIFYITSTQQSTTTVVYTGLFKIYENVRTVNEIDNITPDITQQDVVVQPASPTIGGPPASDTVLATRRVVTTVNTQAGNSTVSTIVNTVDQRISEGEMPFDTNPMETTQNPDDLQPRGMYDGTAGSSGGGDTA